MYTYHPNIVFNHMSCQVFQDLLLLANIFHICQRVGISSFVLCSRAQTDVCEGVKYEQMIHADGYGGDLYNIYNNIIYI